MKLTYKITRMAQVLITSCCLASCNYLDIIPPAQADFKDTMKDQEATLSFLYTCYGAVPRSTPFQYHSFELSADESAAPYSILIISNKWLGELFLRHSTVVGVVMTRLSGFPAITGWAMCIIS